MCGGGGVVRTLPLQAHVSAKPGSPTASHPHEHNTPCGGPHGPCMAHARLHRGAMCAPCHQQSKSLDASEPGFNRFTLWPPSTEEWEEQPPPSPLTHYLDLQPRPASFPNTECPRGGTPPQNTINWNHELANQSGLLHFPGASTAFTFSPSPTMNLGCTTCTCTAVNPQTQGAVNKCTLFENMCTTGLEPPDCKCMTDENFTAST